MNLHFQAQTVGGSGAFVNKTQCSSDEISAHVHQLVFFHEFQLKLSVHLSFKSLLNFELNVTLANCFECRVHLLGAITTEKCLVYGRKK